VSATPISSATARIGDGPETGVIDLTTGSTAPGLHVVTVPRCRQPRVNRRDNHAQAERGMPYGRTAAVGPTSPLGEPTVESARSRLASRRPRKRARRTPLGGGTAPLVKLAFACSPNEARSFLVPSSRRCERPRQGGIGSHPRLAGRSLRLHRRSFRAGSASDQPATSARREWSGDNYRLFRNRPSRGTHNEI